MGTTQVGIRERDTQPRRAGRVRAPGLIGSEAVGLPEARVRGLSLGALDRDTFAPTPWSLTGLE